ncbi:sugar ABC transporter substrate-binding protein [Mesorhizobium sp.]|uniref:sugar ABC transporter substrate-binding protein n=1 Tax=Mesorhizobium sp. TaxID=1871066 RepID=UPI000FE541B6|nr:sugar ABC transporter substrate-binding protein [Mesorhizobium sp.]RWP36311.1 MAG: sugar ABC transporter substrate-binding protein [Mesorhizobium sp.]TIL65015.1 MAG: sugar ABC transporter substrate-binding protein [Mesorhizobium sp.]
MNWSKSILFASAAALALSAAAARAENMPKRIGYVTNYATHEWYQNVIKGMQARAKELGIELEVQDANLDIAKQVSAAEDFMAKGVDVLIVTPVNEEGVVPLLRQAKSNDVPVVLEGNPVKGMTTMVAICDYDTGYTAGVEAGKYAKEKLGGKAQVMNVGLPLLSATVLRSQGFMDGLKTIIPDAVMVHDLDGGGNPDRALEVSSAALAKNADINIIYGINDSSSLGGLQAWKAAGKSQDNLLTVGTGGEGLAFINAIQNEPSYRIEAAMFPEKEGYTAIDAAVKLFNGEEVPEHIVSPTAPMKGDDWKKYYDYDGTVRTIKWDAVNALQPPEKCMKTSADLKK